MADIRGRVEKVRLLPKFSTHNKFALGQFYSGHKTQIRNMHPYVKNTCLVRIDPHNPDYSNFISLKIPNDFPNSGLDNADVVFIGRWNRYWRHLGDVPTIPELNSYYDPGKMGRFVYISSGSNGSKGISLQFLIMAEILLLKYLRF